MIRCFRPSKTPASTESRKGARVGALKRIASAVAADRLLSQHTQEQAQAQQQQEENDPLTVMQKRELEIKAAAVKVKEAEAQADAQYKADKIKIDAAKAVAQGAPPFRING